MKIEWASEVERTRFAKLAMEQLLGSLCCLNHDNCPSALVAKAKHDVIFWYRLAQECDPTLVTANMDDLTQRLGGNITTFKHIDVNIVRNFAIFCYSPEGLE